MHALTTELVLEQTDVNELEDVRILNLSAHSLWNLSLAGTVDFARLMRLEVLDLSNNKLRTVHELASITSLLELNIDNNYIQEISYLQPLQALNTLHVRNNVLENLSGIHLFKNLKILSISGNCVSVDETVEQLNLCLKLEILEFGEIFDHTHHIPWLKVLDGVHLSVANVTSAYDHLLLRTHKTQSAALLTVTSEDRINLLETENGRLKEYVASLENDEELKALRVEVASLRILAEENSRLREEVAALKKSKPGNSILAKQLEKMASRPQTPMSRPQTAGSLNLRNSRPSTALSLPHVVEASDEDDADLDALLEQSQRDLIEAELSLAETELQFKSPSRVCTAASSQ